MINKQSVARIAEVSVGVIVAAVLLLGGWSLYNRDWSGDEQRRAEQVELDREAAFLDAEIEQLESESVQTQLDLIDTMSDEERMKLMRERGLLPKSPATD